MTKDPDRRLKTRTLAEIDQLRVRGLQPLRQSIIDRARRFSEACDEFRQDVDVEALNLDPDEIFGGIRDENSTAQPRNRAEGATDGPLPLRSRRGGPR